MWVPDVPTIISVCHCLVGHFTTCADAVHGRAVEAGGHAATRIARRPASGRHARDERSALPPHGHPDGAPRQGRRAWNRHQPSHEEVPLTRLLDLVGKRSKGSTGQRTLFAGGPVQPQIGFIVHSADYHRPGTIDIDGRVAMTPDPEVLRDIGHHQGATAEPRRVRLRRLGTWPARRRTDTRRLVYGAGGSKIWCSIPIATNYGTRR